MSIVKYHESHHVGVLDLYEHQPTSPQLVALAEKICLCCHVITSGEATGEAALCNTPRAT